MAFDREAKNRKEVPIFSSGVYFWWMIFVLVLLFISGMVTAYKNATAKDPNALPERIVDLGDDAEDADALSAGGAYGQAAAKFRSGDAGARAEALAVMMSTDASRGENAVRRALRDAAPLVRQRALELAATYQVAVGSGSVVPYLSDADPGVRAAAAGLISRRPYDASVMYPLSTPLGSGDAAVFATALEVWTQFASQDPAAAAQALAPAFGSGDPTIVAGAVNAVNVVPASSRAPFRSHLQGVAARLAGTPTGDLAASLAAQIP